MNQGSCSRVRLRGLLLLFFALSSLGGAAFSASSPVPHASLSSANSRFSPVVIVGGGLAGLGALHELRRQGVDVVLLEKLDRVGGRILTHHKGPWVLNGGAELVDSHHRGIFNLARELGVTVARREVPPRDVTLIRMEGRWMPESSVLRRIQMRDGSALAAFHVAQESVLRVKGRGFRRPSPEDHQTVKHLDVMTADRYLDWLQAGQIFRQLAEQVLFSETGRKLSEVSALILFDLFGVEEGRLSILPYNDESHVIVGGTDQLVNALHTAHRDHVYLQHEVTRIRPWGESYILEATNSEGKTISWLADKVILTMPPTPEVGEIFDTELPHVLFDDLMQSQFASNTKIVILMSERTWRPFAGIGWDPTLGVGYQIWDSSTVEGAAVTIYTGDITGDRALIADFVGRVLGELSASQPGLAAAYLSHTVFNWPVSYPGAWRPGERQWQMTRMRSPVVRAGNIFWAGDRWSLGSAGYMQGALESGQVTARRVIEEMRTMSIRCEQLFTVPEAL